MDSAQTTAVTELHPTLWRTCRVLANRRRLRMLCQLFLTPGLPVSDVATLTQTPPMLASQYLRSLNARGLLAASRQGRFVFYRPSADPSVPFSYPLLDAMRKALSSDSPKAIDRTFISVTSFTHPRRIAIVRALADGPISKTDLVRSTRISLRALNRHIKKLVRRGLVVDDERCRLGRPPSDLDATLLDIVKGVTP